MQRRYTIIIAAIALAALVLIPAAALAFGPGGGPGNRSPCGNQSLARGPADWAGNATAPTWTGGNCTNGTGPGDCAGNATCICDRDRVQERDRTCLGDGMAVRDRTEVRDRSCTANRTGTPGTPRALGLQGRGPGRQG